MFNVDFAQTAGENPVRLGPYESVQIHGESMLASPGGELIGRHSDHHWEVKGKKYFRLDVASPVRLRFDVEGEPPRFFGPFAHYSMADGIAYVDRRFFASYSEKSDHWHCVELAQDCTGFAVVSAA